jgi:hypothetical protein
MAQRLPDVPDLDRIVGVEIEFGGLRPEAVAEIVGRHVGGSQERRDDRTWMLRDTRIGNIEICLDTALGRSGSTLMKSLVEVGRELIPVEIVTEPIPSRSIRELDGLVAMLREEGAKGTTSDLLKSYGLHFNVSVEPLSAQAVVPVVRAFALIEDWLRQIRPIELSRRVLPFVDPYPRSFVDRVVREGAGWDLDSFCAVYLEETPTRNRSLDMLPVIAHHNRGAVDRALGRNARSVKGRPAFHYRLADSRLGDPAWTIAEEWHQWCVIEAVAARSDVLERLAHAWIGYRGSLLTMPSDWIRIVDDTVRSAFADARLGVAQ